MLQKVTRLDSVPTAEETVLTTEVPTKEGRLYTLLYQTVRTSASTVPACVIFDNLYNPPHPEK